MSRIRAVWRLLLLAICFTGLSVWVRLIIWGNSWKAVRRASYWTRVWARMANRIINLKVTVHGDPDLVGGGLIIGNHQGYLDVVTHGSVFKIRFAPKIEIRRWPFLGWMVGLSRPVWIDRRSRQKSRATAEEMVETMRHGIPMLVYAEGTSTDGKHGLLPFKSTPFEAAAEQGLPIQPTLLFFESTPADGNGGPLSWHGDYTLLPHIWRILGLKEIRADVHVLPVIRPEPGEDRKHLANRVHDFMEEEYWRIMNRG